MINSAAVQNSGRLHVVTTAEEAAAEFLAALGVDLENESLRDTPRRMVAMYEELLNAAPFNATTFPNDGGYDELVVAREIPFHSLCEHHLLPFPRRCSRRLPAG